MVLWLGHFGRYIRNNTLKVLKCGAGKGERRSVGPIVWEIKKFLHRDNKEGNVLQTIRKKANWIGYIWHRNCLLKQVIDGKMEGMIGMKKRRWRGRNQLLDDFKENRIYRKLTEETLDHSLWGTGFDAGYGLVVRQLTLEWIYIYIYTGLLKMIVRVLTTCHTQYTWDNSICIFYLIEQHFKFLLHTLQVLYMCTLCDSTNINTIIEFVPHKTPSHCRSPPS